jgi:Ca2+-transporting ATPase
MEASAVLKQLDVEQSKGLSAQEAKKRLEQYGPNELDKKEEKSLWAKIKEQFEDVLARILLASATISFIFAVTGDEEEGITAYVEPFVILLILVLNAIVAILQDSNADKALKALEEMQAISCLLLRDGEWVKTDAKLLVPGDIVRIKVGDRMPADLRLVSMASVPLKITEAPMTGESYSVEKIVKPVQCDAQMF